MTIVTAVAGVFAVNAVVLVALFLLRDREKDESRMPSPESRPFNMAWPGPDADSEPPNPRDRQ